MTTSFFLIAMAGFFYLSACLCHTEDESPSLIRLLVDNKETRIFRITELKDLTDQ